MDVDTKKVAIVKGQLTRAKKIVDGFQINNADDYELAGKKYIELKKIIKDFEKEKRTWLDPINTLRNKVFSYTRPVESTFKELMATIDTSMGQWERKVESERQVESAKIEAKVDSGEMELAAATNAVSNLESVNQVETDKGKIHQRVTYELAIDDEAKLQRAFLSPDMAKIREYYQRTGIVPVGVKLEQKVVRATRLT